MQKMTLLTMELTPAEKIGFLLAVYGAVLSTGNTVIQYINHRKDRADVVVKVRANMVSTDAMHKKMTIVTAINRGKRPVRIEGFAASQLDTNIRLMFTDVRPQVPYQLGESQSISAYIYEELDIDRKLEQIDTYFAYDSLGREFNCHVKPWPRRLTSRYRRKFLTK